jgi:hypothetical protein
MGNIRNTDIRIHSTQPGLQIRFRTRPAHQNAVPKQKRIHLPPMQLREVVSSSLFYLPVIKQQVRGKVFRLFRRHDPGISCDADTFADSTVGETIETDRSRSPLSSASWKCNYRSSS